MERRFLPAPCSIEKRADGEAPAIVGYGAVFYRAEDPGTEYVMDSWFGQIKERILPGAFDRALKEDDCRALYNHDECALLGRVTSGTLRLSIDAKGLRYEVDPPDTQLGRDVMALLKRGDLSGSSFCFEVREVRWIEVAGENGQPDVCIREILDVKLYDVGPVTYPAYPSATAGTRSAVEVEAASDLLKAAEARYQSRRAGYAKRARCVEIEQGR